MDKKRDMFWDAVKGIGYLCVLLGHAHYTRYIYDFHMPLFFIVSGMFFRATCVRRILRNICVPWLYFFVIALLFTLMDEGSVNFARLIRTVYMGRPYILTVLWFLTCLGVVQLLAMKILPALDRTPNKKFWLSVLLGGCAGMGYAVQPIQSYAPLMSGAVPMALFFFVVGNRLNEKWRDRLKTISKSAAISSFIALSLAYLLLARICGLSNMACPVTFDTLPSFVVTAFMGTGCIVCFVRIMPCALLPFFSWIGKCSIAFFLIEETSTRVAVKMMHIFLPSAKFPVWATPTTIGTIPWKLSVVCVTFVLSCAMIPFLMKGLNRCKAIIHIEK